MTDAPFPEGEIIRRFLAGDLTVDAAANAFIDGGHRGFSYEMSRHTPEQQAAIMALLKRTVETRLLRGGLPGGQAP